MKRSKSSQAGVVIIPLACFMSLLLIARVSAQSLYVTVSSAQYTTFVEVFQATNSGNNAGNIVSRTTTTSSPISDEIDLPIIAGPGEGDITHAIANAGLFGMSDQTGWGFANAEAVSQICFSPLADQTETLNIQISIDGSPSFVWTGGQIRLLDLTANSELWNYSWNAGGSGSVPVEVPLGDNIPWDSLDSSYANFSLDTDFLASDQYELTMIVCSNAGDDSEFAQVQLTGLQVVPEPSTVLLLALCGPTLAILRRRRCTKRRGAVCLPTMPF
jgi:hypothetical protein